MPPPRSRRSSSRGASSGSGSRRRRRKERNRKILLWVGGSVAGIILLPVLIVVTAIALIDPATYKARLQAAAQRAFGRELLIRGNVSVSAALSPTLIAEDVALANFAGGSRPDMLRIDQMEVQLSPSALLFGRFLVVRMVLLHPDILLETDAAGNSNWTFARPPAPEPAPERAAAPSASAFAAGPFAAQPAPPSLAAGPFAAPAAPPTPPPPPATSAAVPIPVVASAPSTVPTVLLQTLHIRDGRLTWRNGQTGRSLTFAIPRVSATAATADSPVALSAELNYGRERVTLAAQTGPLARLQDPMATTPWGVFMNFDISGSKLTVVGSLTKPLQGRGYSLKIDGAIRDLQPLSWLSPIDLPPLHNVSFTARLLDQNAAYPDISSVTIQAGLTNLDKLSPGFTLDSARIEMPRISEPVVATATGNFAGGPLSLKATIGPLSLLLPTNRSNQTFLVDATADAGGASLAARGVILEPVALSHMDIALGARIADLSVLAPLVGQPLPPLKTIAFTGHLVDPPATLGGRLADGSVAITLKEAVLTVPQGDLAGDATMTFGARPRLQAAFDSQRFDFDALLDLLTAPPPNTQKAAQSNVSAAADVTAPLTLPRRGEISDTPIPMAFLDNLDGDLRLTIAELKARAVLVHDLAGHAVLSAGRLVIDPLRADLPGGRLSLRAAIDSRPEATPISLSLSTAGVDLKPVLAILGLGKLATGRLAAEADLRATGRNPHALAASLDGRLGLALTDTDIDNALLSTSLAEVLRAAKLPGIAVDAGTTRLRCLVLRMDASQGVGTIGTALLDSPRALINATGRVDLNEETMTLQLRPMLRQGNDKPGIVVPLRVDGGFRTAKFTLDAGNAVQSAFSALTGRGPPSSFPGERGGDSCGPALASIQGLAPSFNSAALPK